MAATHREFARVLSIRGKLKKALRHVMKSCEIATEQEARYEFAQSRLLQAELMQQLRQPAADQRLADAREAMQPFDDMIRNNVVMLRDWMINAETRK